MTTPQPSAFIFFQQCQTPLLCGWVWILCQRQICCGLRYLHEKGMLHRDISLSNVFVKHYEDVDVVKIGDFGLVKIPESNLKKIIHKLIKYEGTYSTTRSCSTLFFVFNNAVMISFLCSSVKRAVREDTLTA